MDIAGKTMDIELAKAGLHMMIEKPISMRPVEEVERLAQVFWLSIPIKRPCVVHKRST